MRISRRIHNVEKLLPTEKQVCEEAQEQINERLIQNSEEFRECIRQLFRLQCKEGRKA